MTLTKLNNALLPALLALSAALCIAWLVDLSLGGTWPWRAGILAVALALTAGAAAAWRRSERRQSRIAQAHLAALARLGSNDGYGETGGEAIPPIPQNHPLRSVADSLREAINRLRQHAMQLQHNQAALEVRARRASMQAEHIRQILSGLNEPILAIDGYDELVLANASAEELFGIKPGDSEHRNIQQLIHCQKLVQLLTSTRQRKMASQRTEDMEIEVGEGDSRWYQATAIKLAAPGEGDRRDQVADGAVVVLRDISRQKDLQKRNAEFVSAVSHEMKTPLASIKAYVELLADGDAEDEQTREEFLNVINSQTDRLQRLVDNLLNLARIEAGVVHVNKQNRSLNELLDEAINVVRPSAEAKNINLSAELSPLYLGVLADRDMLLQAAINLLSNAIKYTRPGGSVALRSRLVDDQVQFEVQDTGVGLSEEDTRRVFEKFYRVKKDKDMAAGTGLGLPLAKHIVEDVHGGKLTVESVLDQGSAFIVTMPCTGQMMSET